MNREGGKDEELREQKKEDSILESQNDILSENCRFIFDRIRELDCSERNGTYFSGVDEDPRKELEKSFLYNLLKKLVEEELKTNPDSRDYNDLMDILDRDEPFLRR